MGGKHRVIALACAGLAALVSAVPQIDPSAEKSKKRDNFTPVPRTRNPYEPKAHSTSLQRMLRKARAAR